MFECDVSVVRAAHLPSYTIMPLHSMYVHGEVKTVRLAPVIRQQTI